MWPHWTILITSDESFVDMVVDAERETTRLPLLRKRALHRLSELSRIAEVGSAPLQAELDRSEVHQM